MTSSVHEPVTSVGGWPPPVWWPVPVPWDVPTGALAVMALPLPGPPHPLLSSRAACELQEVACPQGWRGGGRDPVPVVTSAPGHPQFTLTVFRPAASSGLGAVPSLWNKCQKSSPLSPPLLLCVSLALGSRGWTRLGGLPPIPPSPPLHPHPSGTGLAALVGFAQGGRALRDPWGRAAAPDLMGPLAPR